MPRGYGNCSYGMGKYGKNDAPVIHHGSITKNNELITFSYGLNDSDKDNCAIIAPSDFQYSLQVDGSPSTWYDATIHDNSTISELSSDCGGVVHDNDLFWHWTEDISEIGYYYVKLRLDDGQPSTYSEYEQAGPIYLDPDEFDVGKRKDYWNYRRRTLIK